MYTTLTYSDKLQIPQSNFLRTITIPNSVTIIDKKVFSESYHLVKVNFEQTSKLTEIRFEAFRYCLSLTTIKIPESVIKIGNGAFTDCNNLTTINIPNSVTHIYGGAFMDCTKLANVTFDQDSNLQLISDAVFMNCELNTISIPKSVKTIGRENDK